VFWDLDSKPIPFDHRLGELQTLGTACANVLGLVGWLMVDLAGIGEESRHFQGIWNESM